MPKWQARSKPPQPCPWCTGILQEFSGDVPSIIVYTLQNTARRGIGSVMSPKCEYLQRCLRKWVYLFSWSGLTFQFTASEMSQCSSAGCIGDCEEAFLSVPLPRTITMRVLRPIQYPVHLPTHPSIVLPSNALPTPIQFWEHLDDRDNNSNSVSDDEKPERSEGMAEY